MNIIFSVFFCFFLLFSSMPSLGAAKGVMAVDDLPPSYAAAVAATGSMQPAIDPELTLSTMRTILSQMPRDLKETVFTLLIGPHGSGKSTVLNGLAGAHLTLRSIPNLGETLGTETPSRYPISPTHPTLLPNIHIEDPRHIIIECCGLMESTEPNQHYINQFLMKLIRDSNSAVKVVMVLPEKQGEDQITSQWKAFFDLFHTAAGSQLVPATSVVVTRAQTEDLVAITEAQGRAGAEVRQLLTGTLSRTSLLPDVRQPRIIESIRSSVKQRYPGEYIAQLREHIASASPVNPQKVFDREFFKDFSPAPLVGSFHRRLSDVMEKNLHLSIANACQQHVAALEKEINAFNTAQGKDFVAVDATQATRIAALIEKGHDLKKLFAAVLAHITTAISAESMEELLNNIDYGLRNLHIDDSPFREIQTDWNVLHSISQVPNIEKGLREKMLGDIVRTLSSFANAPETHAVRQGRHLSGLSNPEKFEEIINFRSVTRQRWDMTVQSFSDQITSIQFPRASITFAPVRTLEGTTTYRDQTHELEKLLGLMNLGPQTPPQTLFN